MYAVIALGVDVEVLVLFPEEPQIHIETVDLRLREAFLEFGRLLDCRDAADFRALGIACLDVPGTDAVHEAYAVHVLSVNAFVRVSVEPSLQVRIGHHLVVYAVTIFLFPVGVEEFEAGGDEDGAGAYGDSVGEVDYV